MPNGQIAQYGGAVSIGAINSFVRGTAPLFAGANITNDQLINLVLVGTDLLGAQFLRPQPMLQDFVRGGSLFAAGSMTQAMMQMLLPQTAPPVAGFRTSARQPMVSPYGAAYSVVPGHASAPSPALQVRQAAPQQVRRAPAVLEM